MRSDARSRRSHGSRGPGAREFHEAAKISALAILGGMNLQGPVLAYARTYLHIVGGFLFLQALINICSGLLRFRERLSGLFTDNRDIIHMAARLIVVGLLLETGRSFNLVLVNALRAAGDATFTVYMGILSMACMSLPLGWFLVFKLNLGLPGVWLAVAADEWLRGVTMGFRWKSRAWERQSLVAPAVAEPEAVAVGG